MTSGYLLPSSHVVPESTHPALADFTLIWSKAQTFCRASQITPEMCHHPVHPQCFQTHLLAVPEVFRHPFAASVAGGVVHDAIRATDRAVGLLQTATLGIACCCQVELPTWQSTEGNTGAVSEQHLTGGNGERKEQWGCGGSPRSIKPGLERLSSHQILSAPWSCLFPQPPREFSDQLLG